MKDKTSEFPTFLITSIFLFQKLLGVGGEKKNG